MVVRAGAEVNWMGAAGGKVLKNNKTKLIIIVLVTVICVGIPAAIFAGQKDKINEWETA